MSKTDMQTIHYTIYQTTNLLNGKIYIGKHVTQNLNDTYLGSGKLLRKAINKYGVENFSKEILHVFDNEVDMNAKEAELVTEEFVLQETNYNLCVGGRGGWSYVNREILIDEKRKEASRKISQTMKEKKIVPSNKCIEAARIAVKKNHKLGKYRYDTFLGKTHTAETKDKMSANSKGKNAGPKNGHFGTRWITNEIDSTRIKSNENLPKGWRYGRT